MLNNFNPYLIPSPVLGQNTFARNTLSLNQIENFEPVKEFTDSSNTHWLLVKSSTDSSIEIPDPKSIQIVDYWNHAFPNIDEKLYVYSVEGIKQPRVETEQPTRINYQWFSLNYVPTFNPTMITEAEWRKANVYAAPIADTRLSKLYAFCKIKDVIPEPSKSELIKLNTGVNNGKSTTGNTEPNK